MSGRDPTQRERRQAWRRAHRPDPGPGDRRSLPPVPRWQRLRPGLSKGAVADLLGCSRQSGDVWSWACGRPPSRGSVSLEVVFGETGHVVRWRSHIHTE